MNEPWLLPVLASCFLVPDLIARWAAQLAPLDDDCPR